MKDYEQQIFSFSNSSGRIFQLKKNFFFKLKSFFSRSELDPLIVINKRNSTMIYIFILCMTRRKYEYVALLLEHYTMSM